MSGLSGAASTPRGPGVKPILDDEGVSNVSCSYSFLYVFCPYFILSALSHVTARLW